MRPDRGTLGTCVLLTLLVMVRPVLAQSVRFVRAGSAPGGDGRSWATAYDDLQAALVEAAGTSGAVTEVWVAAGTYRPAPPGGSREATFTLLNGVGLYGGFGGDETDRSQRDPALNATVLSGDLNGDDRPGFVNNGENSYHGVTGTGTDSTAVLDGFTITAGNANGNGFGRDVGGGLTIGSKGLQKNNLNNC